MRDVFGRIRLMKARFFGLVLLLILFITIPFKILAASEFTTSYDVSYDVGIDGITEVTEKITLKNLTNTYFASSYTMAIGSTTLTDVAATDEGGDMGTKVENKDNQTIINVKFNQQITGVDKEQKFTLKYKSKDFASSIGKTWEVNLPRIHERSGEESFNVTLSVPFSFGDPTSISPKPKSESDRGGKLIFRFTRDQLLNSGVSVNFGTNQVFDFNLKYDLNNTSFLPVVSSIALPPDTNYQDVSIKSIDPSPLNITVDEDGNYLAWYQIPKRSKLQVKVQGLSKLYINPKQKGVQTLSKDQLSIWTKSDKFWEKDNPSIRLVLNEIFKDKQPKTTREKVKLIYQYVVVNLNYDSGRLSNLERMGAVTALSNPQNAVCMEFTDLFVALTRAEGIPARELDGYAYSQNKKLRPLSLNANLLHAWPEYFDEDRGWVMVDPTWENTSGGVDYFNKFDLNHLVLAIRGVSSQYPYTSDEALVSISSAEYKTILEPKMEILVNDNLWSGFLVAGEIKISNIGASVLPNSDLNIFASEMQILNLQKLSVPEIPPFGFSSYKINLRTPFLWQTRLGEVNVDYMGVRYTKQISIIPIFLFFPVQNVFLVVIVTFGFVYLLVLWLHYRRYQVSK